MAPTKQTVPLFGYERFFAMKPDTSATLAFVLTVRGDVAALAAALPRAVAQTFNQHPKMRTLLLPGVTPQKIMVSPQLVDVAELSDKIYSCTWREKEEESTAWKAFVQSECEKPRNREQDWPYAVRVLADKTTQRFARVVLLADHYMADATSGAIVLNALLQNAAKASTTDLSVPETPLRPSIYECMHSTNMWASVFHEALSRWVLDPIFQYDQAGFVPALPVDASTQQDFAGKPPTPANPSVAHFAEGTAFNMQTALGRCERERVSLPSATTAAALLAIGLTKTHGHLRALGGQKITMKTDLHFDLRDQYASTLGTDPVGLYTTTANLVYTASEGAGVGDRFWDLARQLEDERRDARDGHELRLQSTYVHDSLHAENHENSLAVKHCVLSDVAVSSADLYTHDQEVSLHKADASTTTLHVESFHVYNSLPSLTSACMVFVSGVSSFNYSMMDKLEHAVAQEFFHWFVQTMEHLGEIGENDSLLQVSDKLERPLESGSSSVAAVHPSQVAV